MISFFFSGVLGLELGVIKVQNSSFLNVSRPVGSAPEVWASGNTFYNLNGPKISAFGKFESDSGSLTSLHDLGNRRSVEMCFLLEAALKFVFLDRCWDLLINSKLRFWDSQMKMVMDFFFRCFVVPPCFNCFFKGSLFAYYDFGKFLSSFSPSSLVSPSVSLEKGSTFAFVLMSPLNAADTSWNMMKFQVTDENGTPVMSPIGLSIPASFLEDGWQVATRFPVIEAPAMDDNHVYSLVDHVDGRSGMLRFSRDPVLSLQSWAKVSTTQSCQLFQNQQCPCDLLLTATSVSEIFVKSVC